MFVENKYLNTFINFPSWVCITIILLASYIVILPLLILDTLAPGFFSDLPADILQRTLVAPQNLPVQIFFVVIFGPIVEKLIFQTLCVYVFKEKLNFSWKIVFAISAIAFSTGHYYTVEYGLHMTLVGMVFIIGYASLYKTKHSPFWVIFSVHAARNFIALLYINSVLFQAN